MALLSAFPGSLASEEPAEGEEDERELGAEAAELLGLRGARGRSALGVRGSRARPVPVDALVAVVVHAVVARERGRLLRVVDEVVAARVLGVVDGAVAVVVVAVVARERGRLLR